MERQTVGAVTVLCGEHNGQAKLREDEVLEIYRMALEGAYTHKQIGEMFGVTKWCVRKIKSKRNWSWLLSQPTTETDKMSVETKLTGPSMEQRIANKLKSSGDPRADYITKHGEGPTRTFTHGHHSGHVVQPGTAARESDPQTQRTHDAATTQSGGVHFTGRRD